MRALSLCLRWLLGNTRSAFRRLWRLSTGQFGRAVIALVPYYRRYVPLRIKEMVPDKVLTGVQRRLRAKSPQSPERRLEFRPNLRAATKEGSETANLLRPEPARPDVGALFHRRLTVAVISWDVCHNPLGRAYLIAEALSRYFHVVLLGPAFSRFGGRLWEPLEAADIPVVPLPGEDFPEFMEMTERVAERLGADAVVACKLRLPSLLLGHFLKYKLNRPLFVDIDDYERAFEGGESDDPVELDQVAEGREKQRKSPYSQLWTRYAENLLEGADGFFVANGELQARYGGLEVPHARDERLFDPKRYERPSLRRMFGLASDDRVVLFAGTPRTHKGVLEVLAAVIAIDDPRVKMLVVGQPDWLLERQMREMADGRLILLGNRPFAELPCYLACADAVCLLQDPGDLISKYQLPAKVVDALAFGLPVLATPVPPLKPLIDAGVVIETKPERLRDDLERVLLSDEPDEQARQRRRDYFLRHLSYAAVSGTMAEAIREACKRPAEPSPKVLQVKDVAASVRRGKTRATGAETHEGDLDLVLVWKQPDMFLYGHRPDMLVKFLAARPEVRRVLVLEPPTSWEELCRWSKEEVTHHGRALYVEWLRKSWGVHDSSKLRVHNFTYSKYQEREPLAAWSWPAPNEYINSMADFFARNSLDPSKAIFIVCPKNEYIPEIVKRFRPAQVIADVVDDHRALPNVNESKRRELTKHYGDVLGLSDFVITNCESVRRSMAEFHHDIRILPDGIDLDVDEDFPVSARFKELASLRRPLIGYVGNLDARIDTDLLRSVAMKRPHWQLVLAGSVHNGFSDVLELAELPNVHLLGVVPYEEAKLWIRNFDVGIIPHRNIELTKHMNPLKLDLYLGLGIPLVSTTSDNIGDLSRHITLANDADSFIKAIEAKMNFGDANVDPQLIQEIAANTWENRVNQLLMWLRKSPRRA